MINRINKKKEKCLKSIEMILSIFLFIIQINSRI